MPDLILHHFETSPFGEKIRLALGYKQLAWKSVLIPPVLPKPDVVIYLQAPTDVLMRRIQSRGRPEERGMERDYISELGQAYSHYYFHYDETPLLVVNTESVDFSERPEDVDDLLRQLRSLTGGTQHYTPRPR